MRTLVPVCVPRAHRSDVLAVEAWLVTRVRFGTDRERPQRSVRSSWRCPS